MRPARLAALCLALACALPLAGCFTLLGGPRLTEKECLMRAMYFESNRSSQEGMLAVGTVVMNRVAEKGYPNSICGVVGQPNQFAPGVLSRPMTGGGVALADRVATSVMRGDRHPSVAYAHHFHQAGLRFPYRNMHYVLEAGGNEFYERR